MHLSKALEGFVLSRTADGYSPSTIMLYRWTLQQLIKRLNDPIVATITLEDLRTFMSTLYTQNLAPASIDNHWKSIRAFFGWAEVELSIKRPDLTLARPRYKSPQTVPYTEDEIKLLLKSCEKTKLADSNRRKSWQQTRPTKLRDLSIILILLDTGMRAGELCRLVHSDLNLATGEIYIRPYGTGRKTTPRTVFIGKTTQKVLWRYLSKKTGHTPSDPLILTMWDRPMTVSALKDVLERIGNKVNIHCHAHRFRHTFAIQYLRNGGDVFTLQRLLGHSSLEMVRRYLNLVHTDAQAAHTRASPVDRWRL